jgi:Zn-dependent M28 family amino/carboxypeptidase
VALSSAVAGESGKIFDGARAFQHLRALVEIGPRHSGSRGSERARNYIKSNRPRKFPMNEETFVADTPLGLLIMKNLTFIVPGRSADVIIVAAHYDTKYFPDIPFVGANDGASGPAVLLELAHCLEPKQLEPTIWLVFFDGEEAFVKWSEKDGLYGSSHFVMELEEEGKLAQVKAMVLVDMVGDSHLSVEKEESSTRWLTDIVWEHARRLGHEESFKNIGIRIEDDHTPFLKQGIPALNIIDFHYGPNSRSNEFWHTPEDTLDKVSPESLKIIGDVVLSSLPDIAAGAVSPEK